MRMKKSAAFRLFHEHSDNCEALSELRSSEFARAIVNMRRSEKRNATFFSPYFFRFFEHSPYAGGEKEMQRFSVHTSFAFLSTHHMRAVKKKCNVFQSTLLSLFEHSPYAESEIIFLQLRLPLRVYQLKCCHHTLS